LFKGLGVRLCI